MAIDDELDGPPSAIRAHVPLFAVPWLAMTMDGLRALPLDARTAYVISLVDGQCSVETLLDVCALQVARDEALDALARRGQAPSRQPMGRRRQPASTSGSPRRPSERRSDP